MAAARKAAVFVCYTPGEIHSINGESLESARLSWKDIV